MELFSRHSFNSRGGEGSPAHPACYLSARKNVSFCNNPRTKFVVVGGRLSVDLDLLAAV
jgi:hypothetical protein